jgi:hypothetical protein
MFGQVNADVAIMITHGDIDALVFELFAGNELDNRYRRR